MRLSRTTRPAPLVLRALRSTAVCIVAQLNRKAPQPIWRNPMTAFNAIRRRLATRSASQTRSKLARLLDINATLLLINLAAFQFFGANAFAAPIVISSGHHTDRFAPNSVPGWPVGDFV